MYNFCKKSVNNKFSRQLCLSNNRKIKKYKICTVPNALSLSRIISTVPVIHCINHDFYWPALIVFTTAAVSDGIDGYIARKYPSQSSRIGSFIDPLADKVLMIGTFSILTIK
ncbi:hypothetical protein A3Q56_07310, partial [Intoshia linei]